MALYANEQKAIEKARTILPAVEMVAKLAGGGARFKVTRYALRPHGFNARTGTAFDWDNEAVDVRTVTWTANTPTAWRKATCDCEWGRKGGHGCYHVQAVRLEWERRDTERSAQLRAEHQARQLAAAAVTA